MAKRQRRFADDSWAVWVDGDDVSTIFINDWMNPKGNSYVDFAVHTRGVKNSKSLCVYVPFDVSKNEIEEQKEFIGTINQEVIRLNTMVNDILDFSRLQSDKTLENRRIYKSKSSNARRKYHNAHCREIKFRPDQIRSGLRFILQQ